MTPTSTYRHPWTILGICFVLCMLLLLPSNLRAQCPNNNTLAFGAPQDMTPSGVGNTITNVQIWGGEYTTVNVVTGNNYTISTCTDLSGLNTHLTLYNEGTGVVQAFNDDFCGIRSQINYTATFTGVLRVLLDQSPGCGFNSTNQTMTVTLNSVACSAPTITTNPSNAIVCPGAMATFTAAAGGTPDSLRWFRSTDGGTTWLRIINGAPYSGATTGTLTVNPASAGISGTRYRLTAYKCSGPVQSVNSTAAILTSTDATAPTALCRNITRNISGTTASVTAADINNGSTDNCGTVNLVSATPSSFTCANIGTNNVTLTINDGNGNTATCVGVVTIADVTAPTALCRSITRPLVGTTASVTASDINNGSTDNCGTVNLVSATPSSFTCANIGANNVTLAINDGRGNTATCVGVVTITDTTRPSITCPANISTSTNAGSCIATGVSLGSPTTSDNCTASPGTSNNGPASYTAGVTNVTWTATDASGNSRTCVQTVTVADLINPVAVCQNRTVNLNASGMGSVTPAQVNNGSTDNCGTVNLVSATPSSFTCSNIGTNNVTLAINDGNGNTATCVSVVTVADVTAPTALCRNITRPLAGTTASITAADINNGSTDNCGTVNLVSATPSSFTCANTGPNNVTLTMNDGNGNTATCVGVVTITDTTRPSITCPANISVSADAGSCNATGVTLGSPTASDNCTASPTISNNGSGSYPGGVNNVTWTATDASANTRTCVQTVTVSDLVNPVAVCQNATVTLNASGTGTLTPTMVNNGSSDNCGVASTTLSQTAFTCANLPSAPTELFISEYVEGSSNTKCIEIFNGTGAPIDLAAGNYSLQFYFNGNGTVGSTIPLTGTVAPGMTHTVCNPSSAAAFLAVANQTPISTWYNGNDAIVLAKAGAPLDIFGRIMEDPGATLGWTAAGGFQTTDRTLTRNANIAAGNIANAAGFPSLGTEWAVFPINTSSSLGSHTFLPVGANVTLTVTDAAGNSSTCTAAISVVDNTAPTATCQPVTVNLDASGNAAVTAAQVNNGSTDNCAVTSTTLSATAFTCANLGTNNVTLTVRDASNNSATCSAVVTVADNTAPTATCQAVTATLSAGGTATVTAAQVNNGSTDNCAVASTALSQTAFTCANIGANNVTLTVSDAANNTGTCTAVVTVAETTPPNAVCQNATLTLNAAGSATLTPTMVNNGSTDNCAVASTTLSQTTFTCANVGSNTVTLTVTDGSSNSATCTATVTVIDNTVPTATCQPATIALNASGTATLTAAQVNNGSTDNCTISTTLSQSSFTCANFGANNVTLTVTDGSGNTATCSAVVTVIDNIAPVAVCQSAPITASLNALGNATITAAQVNNGSTDNCAVASTILSQTTFTCANTGTNNVTLTVRDAANNASTCTAVVTVVDLIPPIALCQNVPLTLDANGIGIVAADDFDAGSDDNCPGIIFTASQTTFTCANLGVTSVTITITDASGNTASCTTTATTSEIYPPNAICQPVQVSLDAFGNASVTAAQVDNGSTDNCGIDTLILSQTAFNCAHIGANTVSIVAVDASGNTGSCTAVVTVTDTILPTAVCQPITVLLNGTGNGSILDEDLDGGSSDNCGISTISASQTAFTCVDVPGVPVTMTVTDQSGNSSACTVAVTVFDTLAPVALCQNITVQLDATGSASTTAAAVNALSNDVCGVTGLALNQTSFTCADLGVNTVTLTVSDGSGNASTCTATVTVEDTIAPVATCQNITIQLDANGNASATASAVGSGSSDNCSASTTLNQSNFTCADIGPNTVTLTVADPSGNISTCSATVTVADTIAPTAICQGVIVSLDTNGTVTIAASAIDNGSTDNCGVASTALDQDTFSCPQVGPNFVSLTVTDVNGNTSVCTAIVTVIDLTPVPVVTFANDTLTVVGNYAAVQWYYNGAIIPGAILPFYVPTADGFYTAQVTDFNGCSRTSADISVIVTSMRDALVDILGLSIYPNPTQNHLYLQAEKVAAGQVVLQVTDMHGRILFSQNQSGLPNSTRIELPALANGMYLLHVRHAQKGNATFKFVVE